MGNAFNMSKKTYLEIVDKSTYIAEYPANVIGADYVVGDIHGQFSKLEEKLAEVNFNFNSDRLFCSGDLVDRGPESHRVTEFLSQDWFYSVRGNHDEFVLRSYYEDEGFSNNRWSGEINGGSWWFNIEETQKESIAEGISKLPYVIEINTPRGLVVIAHANLPFFLPWSDIKEKIKNNSNIRHYIQWNRDRALHIKDEIIDGIYKAYFGHTVFREITTYGNCTFLDTGSGYEDFDGTIYEREDPRIAILKIS